MPVTGSTLWPHQAEAVTKGLRYGHVACFLPPGSGKTRIALELTRRWGRSALPILVITEPAQAHAWGAEARKWLPALPVTVAARGPTPPRRLLVVGTIGAIVINYHAVFALREQLRSRSWGTVILDESAAISTPAARVTKTLWVSSSLVHAPHRVILQAWPFRKGLDQVFAPFRFVDGGDALGTRFFDFRQTYFTPDPSGYGWTPQIGAEARLAEAVAGKSVILREDEFDRRHGLPDEVERDVVVPLEGRLRTTYDDARRDWHVEGRNIEASTERAMRLLQIASGVVWTDPANPEFVPDNPKTQTLIDMSKGWDSEERIVVYGWWVAEVEGLVQALHAATGRPTFALRSGSDYAETLGAWVSSSGGVLVCQARMAKGWQEGACARYAVFHSQPYSAYDRNQAIRRLKRPPQTRVVHVVNLIADDTLDTQHLQGLREERDFAELVQRMVQRAQQSDVEEN